MSRIVCGIFFVDLFAVHVFHESLSIACYSYFAIVLKTAGSLRSQNEDRMTDRNKSEYRCFWVITETDLAFELKGILHYGFHFKAMLESWNTAELAAAGKSDLAGNLRLIVKWHLGGHDQGT